MIRILKKDVERKRLKVRVSDGTVLTCKPVRQLPVQDLLFKLGVDDRLMEAADPAEIQGALTEQSETAKLDTAKAAITLFNYCMAYGIEEDPPVEAVTELAALGIAPRSRAALRATWLNYLVLADAEEAGLLTGVILALTFRPDALEQMGEMQSVE